MLLGVWIKHQLLVQSGVFLPGLPSNDTTGCLHIPRGGTPGVSHSLFTSVLDRLPSSPKRPQRYSQGLSSELPFHAQSVSENRDFRRHRCTISGKDGTVPPRQCSWAHWFKWCQAFHARLSSGVQAHTAGVCLHTLHLCGFWLFCIWQWVRRMEVIDNWRNFVMGSCFVCWVMKRKNVWSCWIARVVHPLGHMSIRWHVQGMLFSSMAIRKFWG